MHVPQQKPAHFPTTKLLQTWQDRRYGRVVAEKREAVVETVSEKVGSARRGPADPTIPTDIH